MSSVRKEYDTMTERSLQLDPFNSTSQEIQSHNDVLSIKLRSQT